MLTFSFYKHRWWRRASALSVAESYPTSEVRDTGPECQAVTVQERPGGVTPRPRSVAARRHPASEVRGSREKPLCAQGQGRQLGGATHTRNQGRPPGGATQGEVAEQAQEDLKQLSHVEGQERRR